MPGWWGRPAQGASMGSVVLAGQRRHHRGNGPRHGAGNAAEGRPNQPDRARQSGQVACRRILGSPPDTEARQPKEGDRQTQRPNNVSIPLPAPNHQGGCQPKRHGGAAWLRGTRQFRGQGKGPSHKAPQKSGGSRRLLSAAKVHVVGSERPGDAGASNPKQEGPRKERTAACSTATAGGMESSSVEST